mmetsp:Transcript_42117/g.108422  ORF Transcript_42117/g.108422 Transcript_42117/m.108422 type:complete len:94 (+) Transcript_42117:139-420(+)
MNKSILASSSSHSAIHPVHITSRNVQRIHRALNSVCKCTASSSTSTSLTLYPPNQHPTPTVPVPSHQREPHFASLHALVYLHVRKRTKVTRVT